jgi:N4-gp56 family major capsid protein
MPTYNEPTKGKLVAYAPDAQGQYNTQSGVTIKPDAYYDMMLLKMLRQMEFHYSKYAIQKSLPKNYGDTINWRRFKKLEVANDLGLLTEGVTPDGKEGVAGEAITAVIQQYGEVMYFTDLVDLQQLDDVRREYTIELGYIAQETLDTIVRNTLVAEGSVYFQGPEQTPSTSVAAVSAGNTAAFRPSIDTFRRIILGFKKDYVKGVRGAANRYVALVSPEVMFALFDDQRMLQYMNFGQTNAPLMDGMVIDLFGIRFEEVLNAPVIGEAHDSIILADEAYAITKLAGEGNVRVITKGLGSAGVSDPLDQRQSIGYKITGFSSKVLRPESVVNYWSNPTIDVANVDANIFQVPSATKIGGANEVGKTGEAFTFTVGLNLYTGAATTHPAGTQQVLAGIKGLTFAQALKLLGYKDDAVFYSVPGSAIAAVAGNLLDKTQFITEDVVVYFYGQTA